MKNKLIVHLLLFSSFFLFLSCNINNGAPVLQDFFIVEHLANYSDIDNAPHIKSLNVSTDQTEYSYDLIFSYADSNLDACKIVVEVLYPNNIYDLKFETNQKYEAQYSIWPKFFTFYKPAKYVYKAHVEDSLGRISNFMYLTIYVN